jgi:hypothetical protein
MMWRRHVEGPMQCPHCLQHYYSKPKRIELGQCGDDQWAASLETCPNCSDAIINISRTQPTGKRIVTMIYPKGMSRQPLADDVPEYIAQDYREAALFLEDSPKASAALSRRCLRSVLHHFGFADTDLNKEIETLIASRQIPKVLRDWLQAVREIGKFAGSPYKVTNPGEIQSVEPGEPEVLLDALDGLFHFFFVLPAEMDKKRGELLSKLNIAWKNAT